MNAVFLAGVRLKVWGFRFKGHDRGRGICTLVGNALMRLGARRGYIECIANAAVASLAKELGAAPPYRSSAPMRWTMLTAPDFAGIWPVQAENDGKLLTLAVHWSRRLGKPCLVYHTFCGAVFAVMKMKTETELVQIGGMS